MIVIETCVHRQDLMHRDRVGKQRQGTRDTATTQGVALPVCMTSQEMSEDKTRRFGGRMVGNRAVVSRIVGKGHVAVGIAVNGAATDGVALIGLRSEVGGMRNEVDGSNGIGTRTAKAKDIGKTRGPLIRRNLRTAKSRTAIEDLFHIGQVGRCWMSRMPRE